MGDHVTVIPLSCVMQRVSLHYYIVITCYYVMIILGSIIAHYCLFQSPKLADGPTSTDDESQGLASWLKLEVLVSNLGGDTMAGSG